jgi:hypothetical protein
MHQYAAAAAIAATSPVGEPKYALTHGQCRQSIFPLMAVLCFLIAAAAVVQLLRPGFRADAMLAELPTTCNIAEARASITEQLQQQLPNQPQAVVLLWRDDGPGVDNRTFVTAAADDDPVDARAMDPEHPSFKQKMLLVCWLPKVSDGANLHTLISCRM